jgi:hypothetical protein
VRPRNTKQAGPASCPHDAKPAALSPSIAHLTTRIAKDKKKLFTGLGILEKRKNACTPHTANEVCKLGSDRNLGENRSEKLLEANIWEHLTSPHPVVENLPPVQPN